MAIREGTCYTIRKRAKVMWGCVNGISMADLHYNLQDWGYATSLKNQISQIMVGQKVALYFLPFASNSTD